MAMFIPLLALFCIAAAPTHAKVENYQDIITKAQNLSLQRDRLQATQILIRAAEKEKVGGKAHKSLLASLEQLSTMFYSEKAQREYELAESLLGGKDELAISKYQAAMGLEEGNLTILVGLAAVLIKNADCAKAGGIIETAKTFNPFSQDLRVLQIKNQICLDTNKPDLAKIKDEATFLEPGSLWLSEARFLLAYWSGEEERAKIFLKEFGHKDAKYPEFYYWKWKVFENMKQERALAGQTYLELCKSLSFEKRKRYRLEPMLCSRIAEVEKDLKRSTEAEAEG